MAVLKSAKEWVELYQTAITAIVGGTVSSYSVAGRSFSKHSLESLEKLHRYWLSRMEAERGGIVTYADMTGESYEEDGA